MPYSLASSLVSAQIGRLQLENRGKKMLRMEANQEQSAAATVESAQQGRRRAFALLAANLGGKLDVPPRKTDPGRFRCGLSFFALFELDEPRR